MADIMNNELPFKYAIITAGCSYTLHLENIRNFLRVNGLNNEHANLPSICQLFHIGNPSASIEYIEISIISVVNDLLNGGILPENIFVLSNLTQFGRRNFKIPSEYTNEVDTILRNRVYDFPSYSSKNTDRFIMGFYPGGYFNLNNEIYTSLTDSDLKSLPTPVYLQIKNYIEKYYQTDIIDHIINYLNSVVSIQSFLKNNKIDYKFYFMNDIFEGWFFDGYVLKHVYNTHHGKFEIPDLKKYNTIDTIDLGIKSVFDNIDFNNIISYKTEKFNFGGLDEYTITNFDITDFISTTDFKTESDYKNFNFIGQHPVSKVTMSFENDLILPHLQSFLNKML